MKQTFDLNTLKKSEILYLWNNRCRHYARYLEHPACYWYDHPGGAGILKPERVAYLDIESTNLNASFGYILCYCIKEAGVDKILTRAVTPKDIRTYQFDKNIMANFAKDILPFDRLVGYYSKDYRFDIPFLRTRALRWGVPFPSYKEHLFTDAYDLAKKKLRLHRTRMENVADLLGVPSKGHRLNPTIWMECQAGKKSAIDYVVTHCQEDVTTLEAVTNALQRFDRIGRTSL